MRTLLFDDGADDDDAAAADDADDFTAAAAPPAEGSTMTYTSMGSETYLRDAPLRAGTPGTFDVTRGPWPVDRKSSSPPAHS